MMKSRHRRIARVGSCLSGRTRDGNHRIPSSVTSSDYDLRPALIKMYVFLKCSLLALAISCGVPKKLSESQPPSHHLWDQLLKKHVDAAGWVDYPGFLEDSVQLNTYLGVLSAGHPNDRFWSPEQQLAYWINVYNAFTVKLILDHYPIASIKDIKKGIPFVNSVWDIKFIQIEDEQYDLNNIEHGILRKHFAEPRIHFAINCASVSCPRLAAHAYTATELEPQLTQAAEDFLSDPLRNQPGEGKLSSIFSWFKGDFTDGQSLRAFVNRYAKDQIPEDIKITFLNYDWSLNEAGRIAE